MQLFCASNSVLQDLPPQIFYIINEYYDSFWQHIVGYRFLKGKLIEISHEYFISKNLIYILSLLFRLTIWLCSLAKDQSWSIFYFS